MTHREFLSEEEPFGEFYADTLSDCPSDIHTSDSEDGSSPECSSDSDSVTIRPTKRQKTLVIDSDTESENDTHDAGESSFVSREEWIENNISRKLEDFTGVSGITIETNNPQSVSEVTELIFGNDFFDLLTSQTNLYHQQNKKAYKNYKTSKWTDVTNSDMKKFLGLIILMGQIRKAHWREYWSTDSLLETPIFSKIMTRIRFEQIMTFLHFNVNSQTPLPADRLSKIKPLLDYFLPKFQSIYLPKQQLSLDETVILWRGHLKFRTYNPRKLTKCGILVRRVSESESGYICNLEIYTGEGWNRSEKVLSVLQPYLGSWHHIYQDNYYNSVSTSEILLENKTRVCGTIRKNHGIPKRLREKSKNLQRGEMTFLRKGEVVLLAWKDKGLVYMVSTIHDASLVSTGKGKRAGHQITKPTCISEYDEYMKGVDCSDQYLEQFNIVRKTRKWYKKVGFYLINCSFLNAFKIYCSLNPQVTMKYKQFLLAVAREWVTDHSGECSPTPGPSSGVSKRAPRKDPPCRLSGQIKEHILEEIVSTGFKKSAYRKCRVCTSRGLRSETRYICNRCCVPLHGGPCYIAYHTLQKY